MPIMYLFSIFLSIKKKTYYIYMIHTISSHSSEPKDLPGSMSIENKQCHPASWPKFPTTCEARTAKPTQNIHHPMRIQFKFCHSNSIHFLEFICVHSRCCYCFWPSSSASLCRNMYSALRSKSSRSWVKECLWLEENWQQKLCFEEHMFEKNPSSETHNFKET